MNKEKKIALCLLFPFFIVMFMFQFLPFINVVIGSFQKTGGDFTLQNYDIILRSKFVKQAITNSLELSLYSTIFGIIIAFQGAYSLNKLNEGKKKIGILLVNMISNFNGIPLAFSLIILLGFNGLITIILRNAGLLGDFSLFKKEGLIFMYTYFQVPLGILLLYPSFSKLQKECEEMAYMLGASKFTYWKRIGIPMLIPEITGTMLILFANGMGAYASTLALTSGNYNIMTIRIASYISGEISYEPGLASVLAIVLAVILIFITMINEILIKRGRKS